MNFRAFGGWPGSIIFALQRGCP